MADKGVPSAIFMARTHALLTSESFRGAPPGDVLRSVNAYLTRLDQSDLFVTVTYGIYDLHRAEFSYARAGHELPMLVSAEGVLENFPQKHSLPIGLFPDIPLDEQTIHIPVGSTLLLFTDGVCDCRNPQGEEFGRERIMAGLTALKNRPAGETCAGLVHALLGFRDDAPQDDDVTLVTQNTREFSRVAGLRLEDWMA